MKKSLLALAVLGAFAGAASAQSAVTLYGRVDLSVGKNLGNDLKVMQNGSGSRLGLRGSEDLGGGMSAVFNIEHRFNADTGQDSTAASTNKFWSARSIVGLKGNFGQVVLGREYSTAFLGSQLINDPWGWDTVAAQLTAAITGGGIANLRYDNSITYNFSAAGFSLAAQTAEKDTAFSGKRPLNFSLGYAAGPVAVNFGYEKPNQSVGATEKVMTLGGSFDLGMVKLGASYTSGNTGKASTTRLGGLTANPLAGNDKKVKAYMLTAVAPVGQGEVRAALGQRKIDGTKDISMIALGYHYALSKRTTVYADFVRNGEQGKATPTNAADDKKTSYDFGLKHNF